MSARPACRPPPMTTAAATRWSARAARASPGCRAAPRGSLTPEGYPQCMATEIKKSDAEWREELTPEQYQVLRQAGTERAFTGAFWNLHDDGTYRCAGCGAELFSSDTKFDSGSGWPSFTEPAVAEAVETKRDVSHGMIRTEVVCKRCGGHLGHVFNDGPREAGGLRYCINSCSLELQPAADTASE